MKTAFVLLLALTSQTAVETTAKTPVGSEVISLVQAFANPQTSPIAAPKVRLQCRPGKLRTAAIPLSGVVFTARAAFVTVPQSPS